MLQVLLPHHDNLSVGIAFRHFEKREVDIFDVPFLPSNVLDMCTVRYTECKLFRITGGKTELMVTAEARCSHRDNFCKATGRKVALTRALKHCDELTKQDRSSIWDAYLSRRIERSSERSQRYLPSLLPEAVVETDVVSSEGTS